jgi:soluble lytic murein transglycosylase-like protein
MKKNKRQSYLSGNKSVACSFTLAVVLNLLPLTANAKIYIYVGPAGDRVVSDRPLQRKGYRLQHARQDVADIGDILAGREDEIATKRRQFYDRYIQDASKKFNLDPALVKAVIHVESDFNPVAVSHKGARGLMQLMPQTAARYHQHDLFSPLANIDAGTRHLSYLMRRYDQNMPLVLAAYNAGEENVDRYRGIPPFQETRQYVKKVLKYQQRYSNLMLASNL